MVLDPYSYVAPSRVKALLCPLGQIKKSVFLQYADRLSKACEVRLVDVTPDGRSDRAMFSPLGYPNGKVVYDFSLSGGDEQYYSMYDLEPYRQTLVAFGLVSHKDNCDHEGYGEWLEERLKMLKKEYPNCIMHKVLVFGVPEEGVLRTDSKHIFGILSSSSKVSSFTSLETALCDITSDFLAELAVYVISRQMGSFKSPGIKALDGIPNKKGKGDNDKENVPDKPYNSYLRRGLIRQNSASIHSPSISSSNQSISISKTGSISLGLSDRTKSKQNGRMLKFLGNMYLLAGRLSDALKEFTEAANILKSTYDHLWYGSALEGIGICLVLQAFLEVPITIPVIALTATLRGNHTHTNSINSGYVSSGYGSGYGSGHGSRNESTSSINATPPPTSPSPSPENSFSFTSNTDESPKLNDFLPDLTEAILRFYTRSPTSNEDNVPQIIYCETILRFIKLLVLSRQGGGWNGAVLSAIVRGTSLQLNITIDSPSTTKIASWCNRVYSSGLTNLPMSLQVKVYSGLASIYGSIGLQRKRAFILREMVLKLVNSSQINTLQLLDKSQRGLIEFLDNICKVFAGGEVTSVGSGWLDLRMSFLRSCILICEESNHHQGVVYFVGLVFSTMADSLSKDDQLRMFSSLYKAIELSRKSERGPIVGKYWDPYILRDIKLLPSTIVTPNRFSKKPLGDVKNDNVFLYNPFQKVKDNSEQVLIQGERTEFTLKLQNPFEFEVHLNEISLLTENVELVNAKISNVFIPGSSVHDLFIVTYPKSAGDLIITGCRIQVSGCKSEIYLLSDQGLPKLEIKLKKFGINSGKVDNLPVITRQLKYLVIPSQPLLSLKNHLSIEQNWLMILEGEKKEFSINLRNQSDTLSTLVNFSFIDSTVEPLQNTLYDKELPLNEVYECEYFLYKRKALSIIKSPQINPHEVGQYDFQVSGKRGLTSAVINLDYGVEIVNEEESTWTRRISIPVNITVNSSIELSACDVIPLPEYKSEDHPLTKIEGLLQPLEKNCKYFILVLDLRNAWQQPIEVTLWSKAGDDKLSQITQIIHSSRTNRFLIPIKWNLPDEDFLNKPIPSISRRQYVVDQNMNSEQIKFMNETFWYREHLLKSINGEWKVINSNRTGTVELRGIRLSRWMVNTLRTEPIKLSMKMKSCKQINELTYQALADDENAILQCTIFNGTNKTIGGLLRLVPSLRYGNEGPIEADEIHKKIIYNGLLQRPVIKIPPNQSINIELGIIILSRGEYEWTSIFEVTSGLDIQKQYSQLEPLYIKAI